VLLTGVSKFSKAGVFSGLNNLEDISMDARYSSFLGITKEEIEDSFKDHIDQFAKTATNLRWDTFELFVLDYLKISIVQK